MVYDDGAMIILFWSTNIQPIENQTNHLIKIEIIVNY